MGFPAASQITQAAGFRTIELDMSEIRKADGSMTCLSIVL
jgi:dimethylargininase